MFGQSFKQSLGKLGVWATDGAMSWAAHEEIFVTLIDVWE